MEISKKYLNDVWQRKGYEKILENHLHSGTHYSMIFPKDGKLFKAYYVDGVKGPRWLSAPGSDRAECTEVVKRKETRVVVGYVEIEDLTTPVETPPSLDYYM